MNGRVLYFAYGSNMLTARLRERAPSARVEAIGFVRKRRFVFDKVSEGAKSRSGKANIQASANEEDVVHGVVFSIGTNEVAALDEAEKGYCKEENISVATAANVLTAFSYVAIETDATCVPFNWYKEFVVRGAAEHGLPADYIAWLRTLASQHDPADKRRTQMEALLSGRGN
jgi:hypothetical protein